ncbi:MAG TPA: hypothetical protein VLO11_00990, partial [Luteolibacter sp.]|nr:hypothetical protein [Luteolibacter sp.]
QDPENREADTNQGLFRYDGRFKANPAVSGAWKVIDQVASPDEFTPERKMNPGRTPFREIEFKDQGATGSDAFIWSGDVLMDLERSQALKLMPKTVSGNQYLFIEAGGFAAKNGPDWKSTWLVLARK